MRPSTAFRDWRGGGRTSARGDGGSRRRGRHRAQAPRRALERHGGRRGSRRSARLTVDCDVEKVTREQVDATPIRCPELATAERMIAAVEAARKDGDSLGGVVTCAVRGCPAGWGEPVFDRLEADLAKAALTPAREQGLRDRHGLRGHGSPRLRAQRRVLHGERSGAHAYQSLGRRSGRHHERRDDLLPRRVQAHGHDHARAADGERRARGHHDQGPRAPRPCVLPRARCRWWKR